MGLKITTDLSETSQTQTSKSLKSKISHCHENKGSEKQLNQLPESGTEKEEGCAEQCAVTAQMKENQGFPMSNNGSISESQPGSAPQYQQHQYQPMAPWLSIDGQQKEVGKSSDKLSQIQNQCPKLNRDLEWPAQERQWYISPHTPVGSELTRHVCDNFHFFGGKPTDGNGP